MFRKETRDAIKSLIFSIDAINNRHDTLLKIINISNYRANARINELNSNIKALEESNKLLMEYLKVKVETTPQITKIVKA